MSVNKVILIGNLGKDPEIKNSKNNKELAFFTLATSKNYKDKSTGERVTLTEWHDIAVFNEQLVNIVKNYLKKGSKIYLEGELQTSKYIGIDNIERYRTKIILDYGAKIDLLSPKDEQVNNTVTQNINTVEHAVNFNDMDDEIPF